MEVTPLKPRNVVVGQLLTIALSVGRKPGGKALLGLLLEDKDSQEIPFWMTRQRSFRTRPPADSPVAQRAHEVWGIMGSKQYATADPQRTFWIQIVPYANLDDARFTLPTVLSRLQSGLLVKLSQDAAGPEMDRGNYDGVVTHHKVGTIAPTSSMVQFQEVAGVIDEYVLIFSFASKDEPWTWDDIGSIVGLQGKKIRSRNGQ